MTNQDPNIPEKPQPDPKIICYKEKFPSQIIAKQWIARKAQRNLTKGIVFREYLCERCGTWHLTSQRSADVMEDENIQLKVKITKLEATIANLEVMLEGQKSYIKQLKQEQIESNTKQKSIRGQLSKQLHDLKQYYEDQKKKDDIAHIEHIRNLKLKFGAPKPKKTKKQKPDKVKNFVYKSILKND